jgi:hypothetical protein
MKIDVTDKGQIEIKEVYSGIRLKTDDGELMSICMRDSGFEFYYNGTWYSAKNGVLEKMKITKTL